MHFIPAEKAQNLHLIGQVTMPLSAWLYSTSTVGKLLLSFLLLAGFIESFFLPWHLLFLLAAELIFP
jgi:hypothetical protein